VPVPDPVPVTRAWYQKTNAGAAIWTGTMASIGPIHVLVGEKDLAAARDLLLPDA
jgi:hypothetical protein